jgi:lysophospholipase L1-like esterase
MRRTKKRRFLAIVMKLLIVLLSIELSSRMVEALGWLRTSPSEIAGFDQMFGGQLPPPEKRLYQGDRNLIVRMRPNAHLTYKRLVRFPDERTEYDVRTNALGFRMQNLPVTKPPDVFRILCLGDSTTFGMNVETADVYPLVLGRLLDELYDRRFEVWNLGAPGYTSRQGLELIRQEVLRFEPDLVIFAYGSNDRFWKRPVPDDSLIRMSQSLSGGLVLALNRSLEHTSAYRLLKHGLAVLVRSSADAGGLPGGRPRVSLEGIAEAIELSHRLLEDSGISFLVLNNDFVATDATMGIVEGVRRSRADYLDMRNVFDHIRRRQTQQIQDRYHLRPGETREGMMLVRVEAKMPTSGLVLEFGFGPLFNRYKTRRLAMRDDGKEGDQAADDGIWSVFVPGPHSGMLVYIYWRKTAKGAKREFHNVFPLVNTMRRQRFSSSTVGEIDSLSHLFLLSDTAHPNEDGHRLIAKQLLSYLLEHPRVKTFLQTAESMEDS